MRETKREWRKRRCSACGKRVNKLHKCSGKTKKQKRGENV